MGLIVQVKLFAVARQIAGADAVELALSEEATVADIRRELLARFPALSHIGPLLLFAVNGDYAGETSLVTSGAEVACIPPVSGG